MYIFLLNNTASIELLRVVMILKTELNAAAHRIKVFKRILNASVELWTPSGV